MIESFVKVKGKMKKVKTKKTRFFGVGMKKRAVLTVAALSLCMGGAYAQETSSSSTYTGYVKSKNLPGTVIDKSSYGSLTTTGNPAIGTEESNKKAFFIYNVATGKFLNMGGVLWTPGYTE